MTNATSVRYEIILFCVLCVCDFFLKPMVFLIWDFVFSSNLIYGKEKGNRENFRFTLLILIPSRRLPQV